MIQVSKRGARAIAIGFGLISLVMVSLSWFRQELPYLVFYLGCLPFAVFMYQNTAVFLSRSMEELDDAILTVRDRQFFWVAVACQVLALVLGSHQI